MVMFVQATFVLATFGHIRNILAVMDQIFWSPWGQNLVWTEKFSTQTFLDLQFFLWTPLFEHKSFVDQNKNNIISMGFDIIEINLVLMSFCKKLLGRYLKVMKECRSLAHSLWRFLGPQSYFEHYPECWYFFKD